MSDTNLTQLIVNHLTRDELHNADFTDHGNELFVQKDHAGVSVGGVGVDALDTTNITNCITEIPQDIKLELNNGVLTLKAGSKYYLPNGLSGSTPVFTEKISGSDYNIPVEFNGRQVMLFVGLGRMSLDRISSGATAPSNPGNNDVWYDTTNNQCNVFSTSTGTWTVNANISLPIGIATANADGTGYVSIDQVFNGFGYIGSTVFALPGVKGFVPNGRNADGTLKNAYWTTSSIILRTYSSAYNGEYDMFFNGSFGVLKSTYIYDKESNYNMDSNNRYNSTYIGKASITSGTISNFATKNAFRSVDYSDTGFIAHQAMPSDKFIDLTLGTSDTRYTAPADGYVMLKGNTTVADKAYGITNESNGMRTLIRVQSSGSSFGIYMPVSSQQQYSVKYEGALASGYTFRFIYANGAK